MKYSEFIGKPGFCSDNPDIYYDFNDGLRVWLPPGDFFVECMDMDTYTIIFSKKVIVKGQGGVLFLNQEYYTRWKVEIEQNKNLVATINCDVHGKKILMNFLFERMILGDTVAALPSIEEFRKRNECDVYVAIRKEFIEVFQKAYPQIKFLEGNVENPQDAYAKLPDDIYATYNYSIYNWVVDKNNRKKAKMIPVDFRLVGLLEYFAVKLGMKNILQPENFFLPDNEMGRIIKEPYVCISGRSFQEKKEWQNPDGWYEVTKYLREIGYRVVCIDGDGIKQNSTLAKALNIGMEDFTGYKPLQERVNLLYYSDFFIGLASGLSWLAWACGKPVVLMSGFSLPFTEFYTPYRIINYNTCNGCFNDISAWDVCADTCPCFGTDKYLECSRKIDYRVVIKNIKQLMKDNHCMVK